MVDPAVGNFNLKSTAPFVDAGIVVPNIAENYNGCAPDLGAIESTATASTCPSPTPTPTPSPTPLPSPSSDNLFDGLAGWWKFDEGTGNSAADSSGNGNNGTFATGISWVNGKFTKAVDFVLGGNPRVLVPASSSINDLNAFTFSAWVNPRSAGENSAGVIFNKTNSLLAMSGSTGRLSVQINHSVTNLSRVTSTTLPLNQWSHIAVTWDGSTDAANTHIYINGVEASYLTSTNGSGTKTSDSSSDLNIGNRGDRARDFDGLMDQLRIYNRSVSPAEVSLLFNEPLPYNSPSSKPGDLNGDNKVDIFDYNQLLTDYGKTGSGIASDLDNNGKVEIFDYNILLTHYGT